MAGGSIVKGRGLGGAYIPDGLKDPLSGEVNFGNGALVGGVGDTSHVLRTIIQVKGSDERAAEMTAFISVQPNEVSSFDPAPPDLPYIIAKVVWGSGGVSHEATIDVGLGTSFSVMASFLRVDIGLDPGITPSPTGNQIMVQGFVAYGRHSGPAAVRTLYFEAVGAGATSANQRVPAFARNVRIIGQNPAVNYQFQVSDLAGVKFVGSGTQIGGESFFLPNDTQNIRVTNPGIAAANIRAMFELNL